MYLQRWHGWCKMKLLPSRRVLCTPYNHAPCHFMQSHIRKVYACLAVTCHLRFWQNDRGLLRATAVTRRWNGYRNKSQHRKLTLEKRILPPLLQGFVWLGENVLGGGGGERGRGGGGGRRTNSSQQRGLSGVCCVQVCSPGLQKRPIRGRPSEIAAVVGRCPVPGQRDTTAGLSGTPSGHSQLRARGGRRRLVRGATRRYVLPVCSSSVWLYVHRDRKDC